MRDSIIMTKYQGFGNDYLVLDANKTSCSFRAKKLLFFASAASDLEQTVFCTVQLK